MDNFEQLNSIILDSPGPSPACLKTISTTLGDFTWTEYEKGTYDRSLDLAGISRLQNTMHNDILLLDYGCYTKSLSKDLLLLWYHDLGSIKPPTKEPCIHFDIIDVTLLPTIGNDLIWANNMKREKSHIFYLGKPHSSYTCASTLSAGIHNLKDIPSDFIKLEEILIITDCSSEDEFTKYNREERAAIFSFNFYLNQVEVIPQDWFNKGNYNFEYQWIARVARDPETKLILGLGIRLGIFQLDETGRNIKQWLKKISYGH